MNNTRSFAEIPKGIKGQIKIIKHGIKYLSKINNTAEILNNQISYEALFYLQKIFGSDTFFKSNVKWKFLDPKHYNFDNLIVNIWSHYSDIFDQIKFPQNQSNQADTNLQTTSLNERRVNGFDYLITITHSITANQYLNDILINFNTNLFNLNILKTVLTILNNESLQICLADKSNVYLFDLLVGILAILLDISENSNNDKQVWKNLKAESILNKIKGWVPSYSFIIDEISMNINKKSLKESLEFFNSLNIDDEFTQNEQVYIDLLFIYKLVHVNSFKEHKIFIDLNSREKFIAILEFFFSIKTQFTYSFKIKYDYPNKQASQDEKKLSIFNYINLIINNLVFQSIEMAFYFNHTKIIGLYIDFLNDNEFMSKVMVSNPAIVSNIANNLTVLSKYSDINRKDWLDSNVIESMNNLINSRYMNIVWYKMVNEKIKTSGLKCLSNLLHGYEISRIPSFDSYVLMIINYVNNFNDIIEKNLKLKIVRRETEYLTDDNELIMIKTYWFDNTAVLNKLNELRRFSSCLKYQKMIFTECSKSIKTIVYNGNNIEKLISLKLVSQLCFSKSNSNELSKDESFINFVHLLKDKQSNSQLKRTIDNIFWLMGKFEYEKESIITNSILISYSYSKRKSAIKLKNDLNKLGYNVWLNIHELNGSNLRETLNSIENCACVLICVCEKYLFNESCHIEAKYAFQLNKPIIGLIIQDGSEKFKCWLDEILNKDSIFLNLNNWNECLLKLDAHLANELKINKIVVNNSTKNLPVNNQVEKWSQDQVNNWFTDSAIHSSLAKTYANFDGKLLKQLYMIRNETPEFFFQSLVNECKRVDNDEIKLADIAFFMDKLEKLFI
jgi:hypothetical protein